MFISTPLHHGTSALRVLHISKIVFEIGSFQEPVLVMLTPTALVANCKEVLKTFSLTTSGPDGGTITDKQCDTCIIF